MPPSGTTTSTQTVEELDKSTLADFGGTYFGGLVKFKTKIVWPNVIFFIVIHIFGFYGFYLLFKDLFNLNPAPICYTYFMAFLGGEGTTAGAHRLWCHRSYKAKRPLRIFLIICQTIAGQNCCYRWVKEHRQHHKFSDTDADPHNASRGLFYSHMGWLMMRKHPDYKAKSRSIYMKDVEADAVVMFQKKHFKKFFFVFGIVIPVAIPMLVGGMPFWKSLWTNLFTRYIWLLHVTWTVNSLAHFFGNKPYDRSINPTENALVSLLAYGEGWHNYHHAFPWDYKTSEFGKHLNFTRDFIEFCEKIGLAYDLKEASSDMVLKRIIKKGDGSHSAHYEAPPFNDHALPSEEDLTEGW